ncbi:MAG: DEAD/DEAH box helicase [Planctomycetota bacterium]
MLEISFIDVKILGACSEYRQTLLFSATFPPPLLSLARAYTAIAQSPPPAAFPPRRPSASTTWRSVATTRRWNCAT